MKVANNVAAIDLFCGVGGLTRGLLNSGIRVRAGYDLDETCQFAYEYNNNSKFIQEDIRKIKSKEVLAHFTNRDKIKVIAGCAPCQPFSTHTNKIREKEKDERWGLLEEFSRLVEECAPEIVSMENVPNIRNKEIFKSFVKHLLKLKYKVSETIVYCPEYGIPQTRKRLVLLASKLGTINLIKPTHSPENYITVRNAIMDQEPIKAGQTSESDPLHRSIRLTDINIKRIRASVPNGTWRDWDEALLLACHKKESGRSYPSVYGRMTWDEPGPTITTQFYNYGTGRFGHPEQDRALSLREGALLQTFPIGYKFARRKADISFKHTAKHIGNAVPVRLGEVIGRSIIQHLNQT